LLIPEKLQGREREINVLLGAGALEAWEAAARALLRRSLKLAIVADLGLCFS
jgi:hypothetical protein